MISLSEVGGLHLSTPANIKDAKTKAFMYACDRQIKKLLECAEKIKVWCDIEKVDEKYLDYLAADCRALLYSSDMKISVKRELITNGHHWNTSLGTYSTMEEILERAFPENEIVIREWFEYGGKPFFFKVMTDVDMNKENMNEFIRMISMVKNVRSHLEGIEVSRNVEHILFSVGVCITESHISIGWEG